MRNPILILSSLLLYSFRISAAESFASETISVSNTSPIAMLFSLPQANFNLDRDVGTLTLKSDFELNNYFSRTEKEDDFFRIDGETWRVRNKLSYQASKQLQIHLSTAWVRHSGGISDGFIYRFHDAFVLPQNGRIPDEHDELSWKLYIDNVDTFRLESEQSSIGDSELTLSFKPEFRRNLQLNASLKLPTGSFSKQTGSEKPDFSLSFAEQNPDWFVNRDLLNNIPLSIWYGAGLGYVSKVTAFEAMGSNSLILSVRSGIAVQLLNDWQLKAQLDSHSPLYNTEIRELGWVPIQISFESWHQISQDIAFNIMLAEDLRPRTVPDVVFSTGLSLSF